jgi:ubiquinone/menaquinone biosynthesis C-methylase UbiE
LDRYGLCYTKSRIINIPCNKVQIENSNTYGDIDQEFLLKKWEAGYQIDFRKFYGFVNQSAHQNVDFTLVPRVDAEKLEHKTKIANVKRNSLESSFKKIAVKMFDRWRGMTNDQCREKWVKEKLEEIPAGKRLLDVGAGEQRYRRYCGHLDYISQDFGKYDGSGDSKGLQTGVWNYQKTDIVSDITNIPEPDASFDVIMCTEVLEHLPAPIDALRELSRLIRLGGDLILTAPFASLTHFSPYHYYSGFNRNFYNTWLKKFGFEIVELVPNGNFFGFVMQELLRLRRITRQFTKTKRLRLSEYFALVLMLCALRRFSRNDTGSSELLCYGYMVKAKKVRI